MAATASETTRHSRRDGSRSDGDFRQALEQDEREAKKEAGTLGRFWTKLSNDGAFNLAGNLAYSLETSIFSILLVIIAVGGLLLGSISLASRTKLENGVAGALPGGAGGAGGQIVRAATHSLNSGAPLILILGVAVALIGGSGLFVTMEYTFGIVFRLRGRNFLHQRLMAIGMLLIFVLLVPIILLVSAVPPIVLRNVGIGSSNPVAGFFIQVLGLGAAFVFAAILFAVIYIVVPNRPVKMKEVVRGTLVAAALLVLYETLFPLYESFFLHPGNYGSLVGFAVVIIAFFYYLAFILIFGAEVNSWAAGQRETAAPLDAILHELQAHNTTRGAAGPTAGQPQEDLHDGKGAEAMDTTRDAILHERRDHRDDQQPPKYAESGVTATGYRLTEKAEAEKLEATPVDEVAGVELGNLPGALVPRDEEAAVVSRRMRRRAMTSRQRRTLVALALSGTVALAGVARLAGALVKDE